MNDHDYPFMRTNQSQQIIAIKALIAHQTTLINDIHDCNYNLADPKCNKVAWEDIKAEKQRRLNELNEALFGLGIANRSGDLIPSKIPP